MSCKLCGKPLAYAGAVFCGGACSQKWEMGFRRVCGEVSRGEVITQCECGLYRGANRPHGYTGPVTWEQLRGRTIGRQTERSLDTALDTGDPGDGPKSS